MPWPRRGSCSTPWRPRACSVPASAEEREGLVNEAAMTVASQVDEMLRDLAVRRLAEFRPELGRALVGEAIDALLDRVEPAAVARKPTPAEREALIESLAKTYGDRLAVQVLPDDVTQLVNDAAKRLIDAGRAPRPPRPAHAAPGPAGAGRRGRRRRARLRQADPVHPDRRAPRRRAMTHRLKERMKSLNWELFDRAVGAANWAALEELIEAGPRPRSSPRATRPRTSLPALRAALDKPFADRLLLWKKTKTDLVEEMSTALQMPGWGNSFTQPIANRIEMLSTGVRLPVAVKVFGSKLDDIQRVSQEIAAVLRGVRGAADVFPDQIVGKGYVEIKIDRKKAARYGINVGDIQDVVEVAMGGRPLTMTVEGRERYPVRVRYARDYRDDVEALKSILVSARGMAADAGQARRDGRRWDGCVDAVRRARRPGPAGADPAGRGRRRPGGRRAVDDQERERPAPLVYPAPRPRPRRGRLRRGGAAGRRREGRRRSRPGMYLEWTGTFEHQVRANKTLRIVFPAVIAVIVLILYLTHKSWIDALLMMTSVLGALAGGAIFQWLFGFNFSVAVQVGYIACFGMAVETGVVMLVYLREAIDERGGLERIGSIAELRQAILEGAIHRLRPKLLTEGAAIISIAPMLWATGVGAEVIRPMAAPVLGGLLIADEVIDVFLPVLYFAVQSGAGPRLMA